ncbi:MAG: DUF4214 domain-containing protein, partial [Proteobacteria bacterium]
EADREPTLDDLFQGTAEFQDLSASQTVNLKFNENVIGVWDQKLSFFRRDGDKNFYAYTRGALTENHFNIYLFKSTDGINFEQVGTEAFPNQRAEWTLYDPHIAADTSVSPTRYLMTMECAKVAGANTFGASVCISESYKPWEPQSWTAPKLIVENNNFKSASTGAIVADETGTYVKWTMVNDGATWMGATTPDDGDESSSTWAAKLEDITTKIGKSGDVGKNILPAVANVYCKDSWDCNNADIQDWKKIEKKYYAIYNGGNYYRCERPIADRAAHTSEWALAIRRSSSALGSYDESSGPLIWAEKKDTCGISYPTLEEVDGTSFLYYAYYPTKGGNLNKRSKLVWSAPVEKNQSLLASVLRRYYRELLGREAKESEINQWLKEAKEKDLDLKMLAAMIINSPEYRKRWAAMDTAQKINSLYRAIFDRAPDASGLAAYTDLMKNSNRPPLEVADSMLASPEFKARKLWEGII